MYNREEAIVSRVLFLLEIAAYLVHDGHATANDLIGKHSRSHNGGICWEVDSRNRTEKRGAKEKSKAAPLQSVLERRSKYRGDEWRVYVCADTSAPLIKVLLPEEERRTTKSARRAWRTRGRHF